jgi:hypothetical protein
MLLSAKVSSRHRRHDQFEPSNGEEASQADPVNSLLEAGEQTFPACVPEDRNAFIGISD